jgi:hypothetical protein
MRAEGGAGYGTRKMANLPDQMTNLFKIRAYLPYINKILNEIEIVMPSATSDQLKFTISDLGNTGFSDDSGADFSRETSDSLVIFGVPPSFKLGLRRVYLNPNGNDANDCLSIQTSCKTLKRATETSQTGDELLVAAGVYTGILNLNITIPPARFFISGPTIDALSALSDDSQYAIFDCGDNSSAFSFSHMDNTPIFQNLVFRNCRDNLNNGGAMKITGSSPTFVNCSFQKCSAPSGSGGAISIDGASNPAFLRCSFYGNSAMLGGGELFLCILSIYCIGSSHKRSSYINQRGKSANYVVPSLGQLCRHSRRWIFHVTRIGLAAFVCICHGESSLCVFMHVAIDHILSTTEWREFSRRGSGYHRRQHRNPIMQFDNQRCSRQLPCHL